MRMTDARRRAQPLPDPGLPPIVATPPDLQQISLFDEDNPYALVRMVPPDFADKMRKIPSRLFELSEPEFIAAHNPDEVDFRLKLRFWDEWQMAILTPGGYVRLPTVYYGVCTREYFYQRILKVPEKLAWMITPPTDYATSLKEILYKGLGRLREILALPFIQEEPVLYKGEPVIDPDTGERLVRRKVDKGLVSEVRQVIQMLSDRIHGSIVQRMHVAQESVNLNLSARAGDPLPSLPTDMLKALDAQIDALDAKLKPLEIGGGTAYDKQLAAKLGSIGIDSRSVTYEEVNEIAKIAQEES